jgi:outer membrane protein OmpA-like peptidoglycan-associated protein
MSTTSKLTILAATLLAGSALAGAAAAQTSPSASQLINALKPSGTISDTTRGIKPLGPDTSAPAAPAPMSQPAAMNMPTPTNPSPTPAAPAASTPDISAPSANLQVDFASGSATLTPRAMATLDELGKALTSPQLASYTFKIAGHTDTVGDSATNQSLSEARAQAVKSYLETKYGIADSRLQAVGMGETDLLVPTPPNTPNLLNRRVQIINLGQ